MGAEQDAAGSVGERDSNRIIEAQLVDRVREVEEAADADVVTFLGPIYPLASDLIKDAVESLNERRDAVMVVLETSGGFMDVAERIALILRHHYARVVFLVPSHAMSAGTILVMSGDSIYMDYASMLGPIDPQVQTSDGTWVPALGYLQMFERLIEKDRKGHLTSAEMTYLIENFNPAELYRYEQERELSISLLREWLKKVQVQGLEEDWFAEESRNGTHEVSSGGRRSAEAQQDRALAFT